MQKRLIPRNRMVGSIVYHERLESRTLFAIPSNLNGSGVRVAQVEAQVAPGEFEVNPATENQPASLFTYISASGTATGTPPPNVAGAESYHADGVGEVFYGKGTGAASGVSHVYNYDADYFVNNIIEASNPPDIAAKVINQSFVETDQYGNPIEDPVTDQAYDNYIDEYNKIIVSGAGNGGEPDSPSTAYNDISVAAYGGLSSVGPTADGRSKPDITAPAGVTSYSTPQVSAAAAVLVQAGAQGYGGWNTFAATDSRLIKAILLNGADKPADWTHTPTQPLDPQYGAGVLDLANSLAELEGGEDFLALPTISALGGTHQPISLPFLASNSSTGWDLDSITSGVKFDGVNNYLFNVRGSAGSTQTLTATLTWDRQINQASINNLDLYLYNTDTHTLVSESISSVDNVQELFTSGLGPGHYDLEVVKPGGTPGLTAGDVSNSETYALAFNFSGGSSTIGRTPTLNAPAAAPTGTPVATLGASQLLLPALNAAGSPVVTANGPIAIAPGGSFSVSVASSSDIGSSSTDFGTSLLSSSLLDALTT